MSTEDALRRCAEANQRHQERIAELERRLRETIESREGFIRDATLAAKERYEAAERENAELREIAWATIERSWYTHSSTLGGALHQYACCPFCEKEVAGLSRNIPHTADCPVTKARTLLGD